MSQKLVKHKVLKSTKGANGGFSLNVKPEDLKLYEVVSIIDSEKIFKTLVSRNALNFHSPAHIGGVVLSSQGREENRKVIRSLLNAIEVVK